MSTFAPLKPLRRKVSFDENVNVISIEVIECTLIPEVFYCTDDYIMFARDYSEEKALAALEKRKRQEEKRSAARCQPYHRRSTCGSRLRRREQNETKQLERMRKLKVAGGATRG